MFGRFRPWIWLAEFAVLAIVFYRVVLQPRIRTGPRKIGTASGPSATLVRRGRRLARMGATARLPPGLTEAASVFVPDPTELGSGSLTAQKAQLGFARDHRLPVEVVNSAGMHFRLVPPGTFVMGSPESEVGRWEGETEHVAAAPYALYVSATEVTREQWRTVLPERKDPSWFQGESRPVEEVTWYDCVRFTRALCRREGLPEGAYRLPTEAEWEYACRAGTRTPWCFGDDPTRLPEFADFAKNSGGATAPVGRRNPNAFGLYDMHGNVWEWCLDRFKAYPGSPPVPEEYAAWRVVRGGNWRDPPENCRSANRCRLPAASHGNVLGFRVVRLIFGVSETPSP
ncbi:MAG: formylglycine-generating enzyme family protein [Kiritimatiellaeota bacterium]|nr:formylglycine-generating enzyme family protein [Kiritimatiellota bacterium]